ncbi:MAG: hypothetical protein KIPDCIKN_02116 [Haliscomenobacter sp.]|jgi:predicted ester cyclase|nr:hypothetical protein [Haliscomenobacter sp.]
MQEKNKSIVRRYIEEVINTGDISRIAEFISPDYVEVFEGITYPLGVEGAGQHILGVRETYPDLTLVIDQQIGEGEWVATCYTMTGTHAGEWIGIKPTGMQLKTTGVNIDRIQDGRIVAHGGAANLLTSLLAIGAVKPVGEEDG